ncbi:MAG: hypothetical protein ACRDYA_17905 [Egibacteraceae bacterium]
MAQPRFSGAKDRSIVTIGVTAALLSVPLAAPIVTAAADSPFQPLRLEEGQTLKEGRVARPVARPTAVIDKATGRLVDPRTGAVIDRAEAVLDPATGKLIDPVTGAIIPSDTTPALPALGHPASRAAKPPAAVPHKSVLPAGAPAAGPLAVPQPTDDLLLSANAMVAGVVDEVLNASSDGGLLPLASLLGSDNASAGESGASSGDSPSAGGGTRAHAAPAPNGDARTVGPASGSDAVEAQPGAVARGASVGGASGAPHLLGAPALSGLHSSHGGLQPQGLEASPQVRAPAGFDPSSVAVNDRTASERQLAASQVTAPPQLGVLAEAPAWLVPTASSLLLLVGGTTFAYATLQLRRRRTT